MNLGKTKIRYNGHLDFQDIIINNTHLKLLEYILEKHLPGKINKQIWVSISSNKQENKFNIEGIGSNYKRYTEKILIKPEKWHLLQEQRRNTSMFLKFYNNNNVKVKGKNGIYDNKSNGMILKSIINKKA